jgi:hypothetical protein
MSNPAKVKVSVESQNPTVAFFKDGSASVQSSLVNVGNEFKMKKYIQDTSRLEDVMTVNEDGAVKFHKNVTFAGDSVVQNVQTTILQDQNLQIGTTNANQVNSSGVIKVAGATSYSIMVTSNAGISTSTNLLFGKYDLVNGPIYTSANSTDNVPTITSGNFTKVGSTSLSTTVNILPTDSTLTSDLRVYEKKNRFDQEVTNVSLTQNTLTITYSPSSNTDKLEDLLVGQLLAIDYNGDPINPYKNFIFNRLLHNIYGIITGIDTTAKTITLKYTNKNMSGSQNTSESYTSANIYFTPGILITNVLGIYPVNAPSTYKFTATDSNSDFTAIYATGNYVTFEGLKYTNSGNTFEIFNRSQYVTAVGTNYITIQDIGNLTEANFSGTVFVSKLASIADNTGISLVGNVGGAYIKGSLTYDNSTNKNLKLENTSGPISIGSDWTSYGVNIGTQGGRAITIGNSNSGALAINSGAGATINTNNSDITLTNNDTYDTIITTGQLLVTARDNVTDAILLKADNGANQTIHLKNQTGTSADAIKLTSDLGGVQISAADEKEVVIGNSTADVFVKVSPSATFVNERVSVVNTNGSGDESILLNSAAGGAKFKVANGKNLVLGNSTENLYVKVSPHSTVSSENLSIVNTNGSGDDAILVNALSGGAKFKVADSKNLVLGNTGEDIYFKVSPSATVANEKLSVVNTNGTAADSIFINSISGGLTMNGGTTVNLATNNNSGAVNIGTLGDRTITLGVNSGSSKVVIDAVDVILTNGMTASSDIRLKENFEPMSNALELVTQLNGLYYTWKKDAGTDKPRKLGFIAQEVEKVIPELVKTDSEGMKSVDYVSVVPVLVEALKHQQKQIDELKSLIHS